VHANGLGSIQARDLENMRIRQRIERSHGALERLAGVADV
jgi:hypothetical protein